MGNMATNVYTTSNYDLLHINKAVGIFAELITTSKKFVAIWGAYASSNDNNNNDNE